MFRADPDPQFTSMLTRWLLVFTFDVIAAVVAFIPLSSCPSCERNSPKAGMRAEREACSKCRGRGRLSLMDRCTLHGIEIRR
jgi:hypothetical protein